MAHRQARTAWRTVVQRNDGRPRRVTFIVLALAGVGLILGSWVDASGQTRYEDQLGALNVGVAGTALVLGACALYLVLFRRGIRVRISPMRDDQAGTWAVR